MRIRSPSMCICVCVCVCVWEWNGWHLFILLGLFKSTQRTKGRIKTCRSRVMDQFKRTHSGSPFWVSILNLHSGFLSRVSIPGFHWRVAISTNHSAPFGSYLSNTIIVCRSRYRRHHRRFHYYISFFFFVVAFFLFPSGRFEHVFLHADYNSFSALIPYPAGPTGWRYCVPIIFKMMFIDFSLSLWERVILDFALETVSDLFKHCYCNNSGGINRVFSFWVRNRRRFQ